MDKGATLLIASPILIVPSHRYCPYWRCGVPVCNHTGLSLKELTVTAQLKSEDSQKVERVPHCCELPQIIT